MASLDWLSAQQSTKRGATCAIVGLTNLSAAAAGAKGLDTAEVVTADASCIKRLGLLSPTTLAPSDLSLSYSLPCVPADLERCLAL